MKKHFFYIAILVLMACLAFMGCDNEENQWVMNEIFKSELSDTTLTAESHELYIKISRRETSSGLPTTWNHYAITGVWDESLPGTDKWLLNAGDKSWITLQKVQKEGFDYLNVKVKSNPEEQPRAVRIMVWATKDGNDNYEFTSNEIYIWQKGKEEKEDPFEVKVRYKGQIHRSMATLDENEHIVYENIKNATGLTPRQADFIKQHIINILGLGKNGGSLIYNYKNTYSPQLWK